MPAEGSKPWRARAQTVFAKAARREKGQFDAAFGREMAAVWTPDPGNRPQVEAYESKADLLLYGGAAGGGKTDLVLGLALTRHENSVIFRRAYGDIAGIEQRLIEILGGREGYNGSDMALCRPGRLIEFGALDRPGSEFSWQGRPHDFIGFDEGAQLDEGKVCFVMGWRRSTTPGQRCRVVIASNPPIGAQGEWLIAWFAPWLDPAFPNPARPGELRWRCMRADGTIAWVDGPGTHEIDGVPLEAISCTFIPARLSDNRFLRDTDYRAQLMNLPEPLRSKLLDGDFTAGREERQVIAGPPAAACRAADATDGRPGRRRRAPSRRAPPRTGEHERISSCADPGRRSPRRHPALSRVGARARSRLRRHRSGRHRAEWRHRPGRGSGLCWLLPRKASRAKNVSIAARP